MSIDTPSAPRNGRKDGPGMWTPGGGPVWTSAGSAGTVEPTSWSYVRMPSASQ